MAEQEKYRLVTRSDFDGLVFTIGKSILNRSSSTNIGDLCLTYGGGGHVNAGTCQVANDEADVTLQALSTRITADG